MFISIGLWYDDDVYDRMERQYPHITEGDIHFDEKLDACYEEMYEDAYCIYHDLIEYLQNNIDFELIDWEMECDAEY